MYRHDSCRRPQKAPYPWSTVILEKLIIPQLISIEHCHYWNANNPSDNKWISHLWRELSVHRCTQKSPPLDPNINHIKSVLILSPSTSRSPKLSAVGFPTERFYFISLSFPRILHSQSSPPPPPPPFHHNKNDLKNQIIYSGETWGSDGRVYEGYQYVILSCEVGRPILWYIYGHFRGTCLRHHQGRWITPKSSGSGIR